MYIAGGKVVLDFYGNINLKEKRHQMAELLKDLHRKFNISATEISDFDDTERCVIGISLTAGTKEGARTAMKRVLEHIDTTAFARVVVEDTDIFGYD